MNVFIFTLGTRGDVQPYIALGRGLVAAGHRAVICTDTRFQSLIEQHGVEAAEFNRRFTELTESAAGQEIMEEAGSAGRLLRRLPKLLRLSAEMQRALMDDGWKAAQAAQPDVVVFHPKAFGGPHFAEKLGVPAIMATPIPMLVPTGEFPVIGFPRLRLGAGYNRATYRVLAVLMRGITARAVGPWRERVGLPRWPRGQGLLQTRDGQPIPVLHGYSRHLGPAPQDWPAAATLTGNWFLAPPRAWTPDPALEEFLRAGPAPVYVGFGSMGGKRARERTRVVFAALERANVRGVVATGWGGLASAACPSSVHVIADAPHDWLFPRMAAVVHHGGAGTTAAGLRAGRPTVVCPFMADQPFWGRCVSERGFGPPPIPQRQLTAERLARAIAIAVTDAEIGRQAAAVGERLRAEDGVAAAVATIEQVVRARA